MPGEECVRGVAARRVLRHDVREELLHVRGRLLVGLAEVALRVVGGHDVPLRRARAERVRGHDLHALLDEVVPALDLLRVAVPECEHDDRVGGDAAVGLAVPVLVDEACVDEQVDVVAGGEEDDVGVQAGDDGLRLVGRGAPKRPVMGDAVAPPASTCQAWMIFPSTVFGVEYATRLSVVPAAAAEAATSATKSRARAILILGKQRPLVDVVHRLCGQDYA